MFALSTEIKKVTADMLFGLDTEVFTFTNISVRLLAPDGFGARRINVHTYSYIAAFLRQKHQYTL